MNQDTESTYKIIVGSDSQKKQSGFTDFVTAIIVHRVGSGAIYFWKRREDAVHRSLKVRIFEEATASLLTAQELVELFRTNGISGIDVQIHVDIGTRGPTRVLIHEVVGMIRGRLWSGKRC